MIRNMMIGAYPGNPHYMLAIVDVRDVAAAHLMAMTTPAANGNRYLCAVESNWFVEMAQILSRNFANRGYKISTRQIPDFLTRLFSYVDKYARAIVNELGHEIRFSNQQIIQDLNWKPRSAEEAIVTIAESLIQHGLV
jgi:nucleoside-diphosphate-sugar epimerase